MAWLQNCGFFSYLNYYPRGDISSLIKRFYYGKLCGNSDIVSIAARYLVELAYQDVSFILDENEYKLICALMERNDDLRVIAVGDDDQNQRNPDAAFAQGCPSRIFQGQEKYHSANPLRRKAFDKSVRAFGSAGRQSSAGGAFF